MGGISTGATDGRPSKQPNESDSTMKTAMKSILGNGSHAVKHTPRRGLVLSFMAFAGVLASSAAVLAQEVPPIDPELQFLLDNGFESFFFAQTCRSIGPDGDVIDVEPLPVGGGRQLECETAPIGNLDAIDALSSTGERFCALGQVSSFSGGIIDPRLSVEVASAPDGAPWTLIGTSEEEITISKITGPGGGTAFPLAADVLFDVIDVQPNPTAELCTTLFGI
jgi:hypothetical protein